MCFQGCATASRSPAGTTKLQVSFRNPPFLMQNSSFLNTQFLILYANSFSAGTTRLQVRA